MTIIHKYYVHCKTTKENSDKNKSITTDKRDNNINNILSNNTSQFSSLHPTNQRDQQNRKQNYLESTIETTWTLFCLKISNFHNYPLEKHIIINVSGQPLTTPPLTFHSVKMSNNYKLITMTSVCFLNRIMDYFIVYSFVKFGLFNQLTKVA